MTFFGKYDIFLVSCNGISYNRSCTMWYDASIRCKLQQSIEKDLFARRNQYEKNQNDNSISRDGRR